MVFDGGWIDESVNPFNGCTKGFQLPRSGVNYVTCLVIQEIILTSLGLSVWDRKIAWVQITQVEVSRRAEEFWAEAFGIHS